MWVAILKLLQGSYWCKQAANTRLKCLSHYTCFFFTSWWHLLVSGKRNHTSCMENEAQDKQTILSSCGRTAAAIKLEHPGQKTAIWLLFVENGVGHRYSSDAESEHTLFFLTGTEHYLKELNWTRRRPLRWPFETISSLGCKEQKWFYYLFITSSRCQFS